MKTALTLLILYTTFFAPAKNIVGTWKTIDDETGQARSVVRIEERNGKYFGTIIKLFREPGEDPNPVCEECPGKRKNEQIIGMEIISDMKYDPSDKEYDGGEILDPESGNIYDCKLWIGEDGNLKVRGYLMLFYRTQTWLPYEG